MMNNEEFERSLQALELAAWKNTAQKLRARDAAQREQLARLKEALENHATALLTATASVNSLEAELKATDQKLLAKTGAHEFVKHGVNRLMAERDAAQAQLAEAVGLLKALNDNPSYADHVRADDFLDRHAQAEHGDES